ARAQDVTQRAKRERASSAASSSRGPARAETRLVAGPSRWPTEARELTYGHQLRIDLSVYRFADPSHPRLQLATLLASWQKPARLAWTQRRQPGRSRS